MFPVTRSTSRSRFFKPTAATPAPATDPFFEYVPLLLNTSATNGAQNNTFLDSSTNNFSITRNGDTTQGSFNPYMPSGYWSGYFDGTGDYLTVPAGSAFAYGTGNFTVEAWVYPTVSADQIIISQTVSGNNYFVVYINSTNFPAFIFGSGGGTTTTSSTALTLNTWNHIAVVREGTGSNQLKIYLNGVNTATNTCAFDFTNTTYVPTIGRYTHSAALQYTGYISNLRVVKGTAVYTAAFTPPTTPLTAITNTSLLCLQDNRFIDNSTNAFAITVNGDTRISKFAPFNPPASYSTASYGGSGYFDGTGDYLRIADNAAFTLGSGDFTVEAWVYNGTTGVRQFIAGQGDSGGLQASISFALEKTATNKFRGIVCSSSTEYAAVSTADLPLNQWVHVAFVRNGNTGTNYINGAADGTVNLTGITANNSSNQVAIGALGELTTLLYTGYISNFRQVVGTAVYTANFTPPTTPLTAITNTSLLLNFTNAGIFDASTINNGQTVGNAQVSTTQAKWSPTSMAFDGTGDYIPKVDRPELRLGTGDFTIEGWVYLNATGVAYGLVSKGTATTGWSVNVTSGNKLQFSYTATQLTGATSLVSGTWYYFAVVRSGTASGNLRVILDGATDATSAGAVNDNFNQTNPLYVGADRVAGAVLNGYLQDVRITNGYARTTSTPTAAFPTL